MYNIEITRESLSGTLRLSNTPIICRCWWDVQKKIPAGTYRHCSATTMTNKRNSRGAPRESIFIPGVIGYSGVFIHMGTGPSWSDGCIVIEEKEMLKIFNKINPKNGHNVSVSIKDR
jgi:hypothetical protein